MLVQNVLFAFLAVARPFGGDEARLSAAIASLQEVAEGSAAARLNSPQLNADLMDLVEASPAKALPLARSLAEATSAAWSASVGDRSTLIYVCHGAVFATATVDPGREWLISCAESWRDRPLLAACAIEMLTAWVDDVDVQIVIGVIATPFRSAFRGANPDYALALELGRPPVVLKNAMCGALDRVEGFQRAADPSTELALRWNMIVRNALGMEAQGESVLEEINSARLGGETEVDLLLERDAGLLVTGIYNQRDVAAYRRLMERESGVSPDECVKAVESVNFWPVGRECSIEWGAFGNHRFSGDDFPYNPEAATEKYKARIPRQRDWLINHVCHPNVRVAWDRSEHPLPKSLIDCQMEQAAREEAEAETESDK